MFREMFRSCCCGGGPGGRCGFPEDSLHVLPSLVLFLSRGLEVATCLLQILVGLLFLVANPSFLYHYLHPVDEASLQQPDAENCLVFYPLLRC